MLNRTRFALFAGGALALGSVWTGVGCTVTSVDGPDRPSTTSNATTTTTTTSTGPGGGGGEGGGGAGGNGGSGGGGACVGVDGTGLNEQACDTMQITPVSAGGPAGSICGPAMNEDPPGYQVCLDGFAVYTAGSAENLQECLDGIGVEPANACNPDLVFDCLDKVYAEACPRPEIDNLCTEFQTGCANAGQAFDVAKCSVDLAPLGPLGLEDYENCVNTAPPEEDCQQAHDACAG